MTTGETQSTSLSQAAYARHRRCSRQAVAQGIQQGLLAESLVRGPRGEWRIADVAAADREWAANTREKGGSESTFAAARARRETALACMAELDLAKEQGDLVDAKAMRAKLVDVFTNCRNKLLGIPSRVKQQLPHLGIKEIGTIDTLIREALEDLGHGR